MHQINLWQRSRAQYWHAPCHQQQQKQQLLLQLPACRQDRHVSTRATSNSGDPQNATSSSSNHHHADAPYQRSRKSVLSEATAGESKNTPGLVKDVAGTAFTPGYTKSGSEDGTSTSSSSSSSGSKSSNRLPAFKSYSGIVAAAETSRASLPAGVQSIPQRLKRLLTGRFIKELQGNSNQANTKKQPLDAKLAAIQFELKKAEAAQQQPLEQQVQHSANAIRNLAPEAAAVAAQQEPGSALKLTPSPSSASTSTAADSSTASAGASNSTTTDAFPATTRMLVIVTWTVFLLQWWPAVPKLWLTMKQAGPLQALAMLLFAYPDTPVTQALCLDFTKCQAGSWTGLLTSGVLHSGLAAIWLYTRALSVSGRWIEVGMGSMELLVMYAITALFASVAHLLAGATVVGVSGAGAVAGVYTAWTILALQHLSADLHARGLYASLGIVLLLSVGLGMVQPAVGVVSIVGGVLGGAIAVKAASPLATTVKWGLAMPFLVLLFALRMAIDGVKVMLLAMVPVIVAVVQGVLGVVQAVRRL